MALYSNQAGIPLSMAVYLASDNYPRSSNPNVISVTTLLKPLRAIILGARVPEELAVNDIASLVQSRMGTSIHDGIERAWRHNYRAAMEALGYPKAVIDAVRINPEPGSLKPGEIAVYLEIRSTKQVGRWIVTGAFDFVGDGRLEDFKSTSTYTWVNNTKDDDYIGQGSMYRWLNPEKITQDLMAIQFLFTDWSALRAKAEKNYPPQRTMQRLLPLKSIQETDTWVKNKLSQIEQLWEADEADLPLCNDKELWRGETQYKYFAKEETANAGGRATKNFDTDQAAAYAHQATQGKGVIREFPGKVGACKYCKAFPICAQAQAFLASGDLTL